MKRLMTILGVLIMAGCASYQNMQSADALKMAALRAIGHEQVAWLSHDTAALPAGMDSLVDLKVLRANVDRVSVAGSDGTAITTYWYNGTFSTADGKRDGTLTVQRRLHFRRDDRGGWTPSAPPEEIARNASWSSGRSAS